MIVNVYSNIRQTSSYFRYSPLIHMQIGIKGIVTDALDDSAIFNASVRVVDRNVPQRTTKLGEFWLILLPGRYTIEV